MICGFAALRIVQVNRAGGDESQSAESDVADFLLDFRFDELSVARQSRKSQIRSSKSQGKSKLKISSTLLAIDHAQSPGCVDHAGRFVCAREEGIAGVEQANRSIPHVP